MLSLTANTCNSDKNIIRAHVHHTFLTEHYHYQGDLYDYVRINIYSFTQTYIMFSQNANTNTSSSKPIVLRQNGTTLMDIYCSLTEI